MPKNKIIVNVFTVVLAAVIALNSGVSISSCAQESIINNCSFAVFNCILCQSNLLRSKWKLGEEVPLPDMPTNVKFCTDYRWYSIEGTPHNRLQSLCRTDALGCRRFNNDYCVGLGSFYTTNIGDRFEVTLESGNSFTIIIGDGKADCDTDSTNMYTPCINYDGEYCANVLEFIIDDQVVSDKMYAYGSLDYYDFFKGDIIKMVYLGRDNSRDWDLYE